MQSTHSPGIFKCKSSFNFSAYHFQAIPIHNTSIQQYFVVAKAKRFLDPSTIFHTDIDEAMQRITHTVQTLKHFRTLFDKYKEKLDTYFIPNQRSVGGFECSFLFLFFFLFGMTIDEPFAFCLIRFYTGHFIRMPFLIGSTLFWSA